MGQSTVNRDVGEMPGEVRRTFVAMLFALVVAAIAQGGAGLFENGLPRNAAAWCAFAQLALAFVVVATSWVGWSASTAPGNREPVEQIFSRAFIVLILDVLLVALYFEMAMTLDYKTVGVEISAEPSAYAETVLVLGIFALYLLWDIATKYERGGRRLLLRAIPTLSCAVVSLVVVVFLRGIAGWLPVIVLDLGLILLVLWFRAAKEGLRGHVLLLIASSAAFVVAGVVGLP